MPELSRRDFLKLARNSFLYLSGALAGGALLRFLDFDPNPAPKTEFDLGPAGKYPLHSRTTLADPPAVLVHNEHGFSAFSRICTHLGCTAEKDRQGFACPCHGSRFAVNGETTHGPASQPLRSLQVQVTAGGHVKLFID